MPEELGPVEDHLIKYGYLSDKSTVDLIRRVEEAREERRGENPPYIEEYLDKKDDEYIESAQALREKNDRHLKETIVDPNLPEVIKQAVREAEVDGKEINLGGSDS